MNAIERVSAVFEGKPPDRTPLFEQDIASDVANEILGWPAVVGTTSLQYHEADALLTGDDAAYAQFKARVMENRVALARVLQHDALSLPRFLRVKPTRRLDEYTFLYGDLDANNWTIRRFDPAAQTYDVADSWERELTIQQIAQQVDDAERAARDASSQPAVLEELERAVRQWGGEFFIFAESCLELPRHPAWLEATLTRPDLVKRYMAASLEIQKPYLRAVSRLGVRVILGGGDLAGKNGPIFSPQTFREMVMPYARAMTSFCHELGLKYVFRSDGNIRALGDDFFAGCGSDGYGEIDQDAGMDPVEVHRRYPNLTLWGGVPCGSVLHMGAPDQVAEHARRSIEGCGGRLILGSSNTIVYGTPAENVLTMVDTAMNTPPPKS